jgi:hypothetical protein
MLAVGNKPASLVEMSSQTITVCMKARTGVDLA